MNITFLIGNGFDRALGLRTGYSHFYKWYCGLESDSKLINDFRRNIDNDIKVSDGRANKLWSDAELGLAKATKDYSIEDFITCCEDLHDRLTEYITSQDAIFQAQKEKHVSIADLLSSQLSNFQRDLTPSERNLINKIRNDDILNHSQINIVTLNYTKSCDEVFRLLSSKPISSWSSSQGSRQLRIGKLVHAHGYIDNFPILGVCDPDLIENRSFLNDPAFRALMIKKESIDAIGETWRAETTALINNSFIICIFGASLGKSDSDYWKLIANWLNANSSRHLIIFWHSSSIKPPRIKVSYYQHFKMIHDVQNKFLEFSDFSESTLDNIRNRIHVVVNAENMFVLPEDLKIEYPEEKEKNHISLTFPENSVSNLRFAANAVAKEILSEAKNSR